MAKAMCWDGMELNVFCMGVCAIATSYVTIIVLVQL